MPVRDRASIVCIRCHSRKVSLIAEIQAICMMGSASKINLDKMWYTDECRWDMQELPSLKWCMHVSEVFDSELGSGLLTVVDNAGVSVREIRKEFEGTVVFHLFRPSWSLKRSFVPQSYLIGSHLPSQRMEAVGQNHPLTKVPVSWAIVQWYNNSMAIQSWGLLGTRILPRCEMLSWGSRKLHCSPELRYSALGRTHTWHMFFISVL